MKANCASQIVDQLLEADVKDFLMGEKTYPTPENTRFYLGVTEEDHEPDYEAPGEDAPEEDQQAHRVMMNEISRRLGQGDHWAYGAVTVAAYWEDEDSGDVYEGLAHLGGCSYDNALDFIKNSGYFEHMAEEAYEELVNRYKAGNERNFYGPEFFEMEIPNEHIPYEKLNKISVLGDQ